MTYAIEAKPLWQPNPNTVGDTRMAMFMQAMGHGRYADLWQWSIDQPEVFWSKLWDFCGAVGDKVELGLLVDHLGRADDATRSPPRGGQI